MSERMIKRTSANIQTRNGDSSELNRAMLYLCVELPQQFMNETWRYVYTRMLHTLKCNTTVTMASPKGGEHMLSRDCDGCSQLHLCSQRYRKVSKDQKVYCPDGTAHLVDQK